MKRIMLLTILLLAGSSAIFAQSSIPASNPLVTFVGRTAVSDNGAVSYDWSGVTARIAFQGTSLTMVCSDTQGDYFNVWVDKPQGPKEDFVIKISAEDGQKSLELVKKLKKGNHSVIVQKRTEGEQGTMTIFSFITDGQFLQAEPLRDRKIEFVGDSYTCGYGTESYSRNDPFKAETENCNLTYAAIAGRFFDADIQIVAHSGMGIARNYNDAKMPLMPERYGHVFDQNPELDWTPGSYKPDIVVIYLGTNDFSVGKQPTFEKWVDGYVKLLKKVREYYGEEVPILCAASDANSVLGKYVEETTYRCGIANVHWTALESGMHNDTSDLGASWHPNYAGQRKVASCMIPFISTLTDWEMPFKAFE